MLSYLAGISVFDRNATGRRAAGLELDPRYVDCAIRRWQQATGNDAILAETGEMFGAVAAARTQQR